jgi:Ca-activated chloride channel family protein
VSLDRDVVVTARGVEAGPLTTVVTHRGESGPGTVALTVVPDLFDAKKDGASQEVVFLIDTSGSMEGDSITEARAALRLCLRHLREGDRFNILAFQNSFQAFSPNLVPFTQRTLEQADRWVDALQADGGTEMLEPILAALRAAPDGVVVLLTDGQVGNEDEILRRALETRGKARIYPFGIGTNVSDVLLRNLAKRTSGAVEFIHPGERIDEKVVAQFSRAVAARVTDLTVKFHGLDVGELAPGELSPLVDGEPWVLFGRYETAGSGTAEVRGLLRGTPFVLSVPVTLPQGAHHPHLPKLWAAERIRDLEVTELTGRRAEALKERIVRLAVDHQIASRYTSFVVVEKRVGDRRATGQPETRVVPVNLPAGWDMFKSKNVTRAGTVKGGGIGLGMPMPAPAAAPRRAPMPPMPSAPPPPMSPSYEPIRAEARMQSQGFGSAEKMAPLAGGAGAASVAKKAMRRAVDMLKDFGGRGDAKAEVAEFEGAPAALEEAVDGYAPAEIAQRVVGEDPVVALLGQQRANGLWEEPGAEPAALRQVRATAKALLTLLRAGVTTAHPLHGTQVKKAVEALLEAARAVAGQHPQAAELALGVAWLIASGRRTRGEIEKAVSSEQPLAGLKPYLGDEGRTRERVDELAGTV